MVAAIAVVLVMTAMLADKRNPLSPRADDGLAALRPQEDHQLHATDANIPAAAAIVPSAGVHVHNYEGDEESCWIKELSRRKCIQQACRTLSRPPTSFFVGILKIIC